MRKTRIPSTPYLEKKISELKAIAKPTPDETALLTHYKKQLAQSKQ
jgi:hypothetical protein